MYLILCLIVILAIGWTASEGMIATSSLPKGTNFSILSTLIMVQIMANRDALHVLILDVIRNCHIIISSTVRHLDLLFARSLPWSHSLPDSLPVVFGWWFQDKQRRLGESISRFWLHIAILSQCIFMGSRILFLLFLVRMARFGGLAQPGVRLPGEGKVGGSA